MFKKISSFLTPRPRPRPKPRSRARPAPENDATDKTLQERFPRHKIGRGSYAVDLKVLSWGEGAKLTIGNYCSISDGVTILLGGEHRVDWVTTFPFNVLWSDAGHLKGHPKTKGDVVIGSDVWLGMECLIGSGISIGHGAVVAARSVVTRSVPPYAIVGGNPAKIIRHRFSAEQISSLLKIEWWNWSEEKIGAHLGEMLDNRIDFFIRRHLKA
jgi:acetyltransferase-like isoleucine patch superfamily enzyme